MTRRLQMYARELLAFRLRDGETKGIAPAEVRGLSTLIEDAFSGTDMSRSTDHDDEQLQERVVSIRRIRKRAKRGSITEWAIEQIDKKWNGEADEFHVRVPTNIRVSSARTAILRFLNGRDEPSRPHSYAGLLDGSNLRAKVESSGNDIVVSIYENESD